MLDRFHFPDGSTPVEVTFGCGMRETGEIYRQAADGILGMGNNANALHSQVGPRLMFQGLLDPRAARGDEGACL